MAKEMAETAGLLGEVAHPGRPKDEEPHIKRSVKKKQEVIDYLVRVDLEELGIDESSFEVDRFFRWLPSVQELQALFRMFDNDKDGVLSIKEFEKVLAVLGRSGELHPKQLCKELRRLLRKWRGAFLPTRQSSVSPSMSTCEY